tara:strand:- start:1317 stop:2228 length:912 start_codon:yes stop_codon:yes gene_type:complete
MKKVFSVDTDFINSRFDKWFKKKVCNIPQSLIEKNLRKGNIKVNYKKTLSNYRLQKNDQVFVRNFNFISKKIDKKYEKYKATKKELSSLSNLIIENNENFVVINKPAGIAVQSGTKSRRNILDILNRRSEFEGAKPYAVHRIDKETTGILVVAKNRKYAQLFTSLFRIRKIYKTYLGIALGQFLKKKGTLTDEIFYYEGEKKIKTKAITNFTVIDSNGNYSLLKLNPITGRKHQLRKQLLMHGHPILGDSKYNILENIPKKKNTLMLHAFKVNFSINDQKYSYTAKLPSAFENTLKKKYLKIF